MKTLSHNRHASISLHESAMLGAMTDQTEQNRGIFMHQNEIQYRNLLNSLPGVAYQFRITEGGKPRFDYVSGNCIDLFGLSDQAIMADADRFTALIPESDIRHLDQVVKKSADCNTPYVAEHRIKRPNGDVVWIQASSSPHRLANGKVVWNGIALDITARKQAEENLKKSDARLRQAHRLARLGHWDWNVLTGALTWSDEVYRIFGQDRKTFQPTVKAFENCIHPDDYSNTIAAREAALAENRSFTCWRRNSVLPPLLRNRSAKIFLQKPSARFLKAHKNFTLAPFVSYGDVVD